jgi:signal transduction histidine kinase
LRGQRLSIDIAHSGLVVHADEGRLTQIFEHVIMALAKHSVARSTLAIDARAEADAIVVSFAASRMMIEATVESLGFTLVQQLCAVHGGRLSVTKATVHVTFPRVKR